MHFQQKGFRVALRQKLLVIYAHSPDLNSATVAWSTYDGTGQEKHTTGDSQEPPYPSVVAAMKGGWRVIQFPAQHPAFPGMEYNTAYLKYEYILEQLEDVGV